MFNDSTTRIKTESYESPFDTVIGAFLCTQLPSEIPAWIRIVDRVTEPGYYGEFNEQDPHIQVLLIRSTDWNSAVLAYLESLGFEGVETVEWRIPDR